jgi:ech hydrogenase subunit C
MSGLQKSPWVIHYDASSCNGCDIEVLASLTPGFDVERFGIINTGNPKHADVFLVTGSVNEQNRDVVRNIYDQMPEPKVVVACGICATSGGIFRECYNVSGGIDSVIPVDVYVPGCAVRPEAIIDGVVQALGILEARRAAMAASSTAAGVMMIQPATAADLPELLALQKVAYQSEAEIYGDASLPALRQSLPEITADFGRMLFLKGVVNGKIVASIRGYSDEQGTAHILRLSVLPYFRGRGLGLRLIAAIEKEFSKASRYEIFTGHRSAANIHIYSKLGYKRFKTEPFNANVEWVYMEKKKS